MGTIELSRSLDTESSDAHLTNTAIKLRPEDAIHVGDENVTDTENVQLWHQLIELKRGTKHLVLRVPFCPRLSNHFDAVVCHGVIVFEKRFLFFMPNCYLMVS